MGYPLYLQCHSNTFCDEKDTYSSIDTQNVIKLSSQIFCNLLTLFYRINQSINQSISKQRSNPSFISMYLAIYKDWL